MRKRLVIITILLFATAVFAKMYLADDIAPKNAAFNVMVDMKYLGDGDLDISADGDYNHYLDLAYGGLNADTSSSTGLVKISGGVVSFITDNSTTWNEATGGDMTTAIYDTDDDNDIDVAAGGTEKSSWTQYCIPYLSGTTTFGEIGIGSANQYLKVNSGATGYGFDTLTHADVTFTGWTGINSITTLGTIATGVWNGTDIDISSYTNLAVTSPVTLTGDTLSLGDITLGTGTSGNYVATIADAGNTTITVANSGSETAAVTLDVINVADADFGDVVVSSGSWSLDTDTVAVAEFLGSQDWGDVSTAANGTVSLDNDVVGPAEIANGDYGDFTFSGGSAGIDADTVVLTGDTTGNYVASITNGSNITGGDGGSEGAALTLAVADAFLINDGSDTIMGDLAVNDVNITGALIITGSADGVQLTITENSAQTTNVFVVEKSDGTDLFDIDSNGAVDIFHTSVGADDHALEIDSNAAGFGDVKAIDIAYVTGAISAGEDEGIILINIDEIAATGGDIFGLEVLATEGSAGIYGMKTGVGIGPIHQDSGTFIDPCTGTDNTTSTDEPNMIDSNSGTITAIFENDSEYIIIGGATAFEELEIILTTGSSGAGIKPTFGYSKAGSHTFTAFTPVDGTNGFRNTGVIAWDANDLSSHAVNTDTSTYDIKITRTRNSLGTTPVLGYAKTAATTEYLWDENGELTISDVNIADELVVIGDANIYGTLTVPDVDIGGGEIDAVTIGTNSACTELQVNNININGDTITGSGAGNLVITNVGVEEGSGLNITSDGSISLTPGGSERFNVSGETHLYTGAFWVGSGTFINLGSDAYILATSDASHHAGFTANRGAVGYAASIDLLTGQSLSTGWSMQMAPNQTTLRFIDRVNSVNLIELTAGAGVTGTMVLSGDLTAGAITATDGNSTEWNAAYTHSQDNSQAHTDYLINTGNDSTSGILTAAGFNLNDTGTAITEGASNLVRVTTSNGYLDIGSGSIYFAHFQTDRGQFSFNKPATFGGSLKLYEGAAALSDTAGYGQLWVKNDAPNILMFTDDAGNDFTVDVTGVEEEQEGGQGNDFSYFVEKPQLEQLLEHISSLEARIAELEKK